MRRLPRRHRIVLATLLPDHAHPILTKGVEGSDFDTFYAEFTKTGHPKLRLSFRVALFVATWISPLLIGRIPPLSLYGEPARVRALERLFSSRFYLLRQAGLGLKLVLSLCYGADAEVRRALGIWPPGQGLVERLR